MDLLDREVRQAVLGKQENEENQGRQDLQDSKGRQVPLVLPDQADLQARLEKEAKQDHLDPEEKPVQEERQERLDHQVII